MNAFRQHGRTAGKASGDEFRYRNREVSRDRCENRLLDPEKDAMFHTLDGCGSP
jgi:hypothetical protein